MLPHDRERPRKAVRNCCFLVCPLTFARDKRRNSNLAFAVQSYQVGSESNIFTRALWKCSILIKIAHIHKGVPLRKWSILINILSIIGQKLTKRFICAMYSNKSTQNFPHETLKHYKANAFCTKSSFAQCIVTNRRKVFHIKR